MCYDLSMIRDSISTILITCTLAFVSTSCQSGADAFVDDRLRSICDEAYRICGLPAGCVLDRNHYIEGAFPGSRRFVVVTESRDVKIIVRLYFETQVAPGTQFLLHAFEPNCIIDKEKAEVIWENVDIFDEAGGNRTLQFELEVADEGEHLVEISSDAATDYLIVVDQSY